MSQPTDIFRRDVTMVHKETRFESLANFRWLNDLKRACDRHLVSYCGPRSQGPQTRLNIWLKYVENQR